ncbi:MMPL family transporter [Agromyces sp. Soil535]|uniref:MMPL family transporter n=1 Tax=Agromyces sp. Soil535 TaxID=1736390 RepID=UPI0009EB3BBE|nr:MMPL family transporter [Agromyces sp. Soil535]
MPRFLARVGSFSARHRLLITAAWLVILGFLTTVAVTSMNTGESTVSIPDTEASQTLSVVEEEFPSLVDGESETKTLQLVLQAPGDAKVTDPAMASDIAEILVEARALPNVESVSNPLDPAQPYISEDQTTAVAVLTFTGVTDANQEHLHDEVLDLAESASADFRAEVGGHLSAEEIPEFGIGELVGVGVAFLVLLLTFGSLVAAGANLLISFAGVGVGVVGILAYSAISPIEATTISLATMLGLAVGIDYSLFILTRFRTELREGRTVEDAIGRASGTAGTSVVFAGLTVIIALVGLSVTGISTIRDMGFAAAFAVLVAVLMALTLLPVLMRTMGRRVLPRRERHSRATRVPSTRAPQPFLERWARFLTRHPIVSVLATVLVIGVVAAPMLTMRTATSIPGGADPNDTERRAYDLIVDEFGGVQSPLLVLVQGEGVSGRVDSVRNMVEDLEGVRMVLPGPVTDQDDAALVTVIPDGSPIDEATSTLVNEIRGHADSIPGVELEVTGETAIGVDSDTMLHNALIQYLVVIIGLSFVLLVVMFRSLLVPLIATLGYLLSVGASFGASTAVFQWGWLDPIIPAPQGDPMLSVLPIILVGVLFGLAMDYQVFLVSRIQEMHSKGMPPKEAIVSGFTRSAPVLVAAAAIMTAVFAGFASSPMAMAASIALGLVVGVVVDAFLVRMVIMPALLSLLGRSAWWLPRWLQRVLPDLDTEGRSLEEQPAAVPGSDAPATEDPAVEEPVLVGAR